MTSLATTQPMWGHQQQAVDFALRRKATLFHMGLGTGKSRCAIEVAQQEGARRVLILCPLSVCDAWQTQFDTFSSGFKLAVLNKGSVAQKVTRAKGVAEQAIALGKPFVCVVNYESARNNPLAGWLAKQRFDLLVLDESHRIKSPSGSTSRWVSRLAQTCGKRVALTGTPMPHSPLDVYAQFRSLDPKIFGWSFVQFRRRFAQMGGFQGKQVTGYQNLEQLREKMASITFQASRDVLDLPDAIHERRVVSLSPKAKRMYAELETDFRTCVKEGEVTAANALVKLLRLQQLTSGRVTVDDDEKSTMVKVDDAKEVALGDLLVDLPEDEPVVVFGRFKSDLASVHAAAKKVGRASLELSGSRKELSEWQRGDAPILAVQIQSGGTGIDLTRAAYCIYLSVGHSLGDYEQSLARVHRPGQNRTVFYYHIVAGDTIDLKVYSALRNRKNIVEAVLDDISNPNK